MSHNHLFIYCVTGTFGGDFNLAVILIWRFGRFSSDRQIKITANTVVLSQVLMMNELIRQTKYPPICFSSHINKLNVHKMYHSYGIFRGCILSEVTMCVTLCNTGSSAGDTQVRATAQGDSV